MRISQFSSGCVEGTIGLLAKLEVLSLGDVTSWGCRTPLSSSTPGEQGFLPLAAEMNTPTSAVVIDLFLLPAQGRTRPHPNQGKPETDHLTIL